MDDGTGGGSLGKDDTTPGAFAPAENGTIEAPYKIASIEDLVFFQQSIEEDYFADKCFEIIIDMDFASADSYVDPLTTEFGDINGNSVVEGIMVELTTGKGFDPIGNNSQSAEFAGSIEGHNKTISNLYINRPDAPYVGLIGKTSCDNIIQNLNIAGGTIIGNEHVGAIVGLNLGTIQNCSNSASVSGNQHVGGIAGDNNSEEANIDDSENTGEVTATLNCSGGITGHNNGNINNVKNSGTITGATYVGGLVGDNDDTVANITNSVNTGTVTATSNYVGGIAGHNKANISGTHNSANITGLSYVGGISGRNQNAAGIIQKSYNTGSITDTSSSSTYIGGIVRLCIK